MNKDLYKYKIELHAHTYPVSGCSEFSPYETIKQYSESGVDGIVITNHFKRDLFARKDAVKFYLDDYYAAVKEGKRRNIRVYLGVEIQFDENPNDYLVYGIDEEWLERAVKYFPLGVKPFLRDFRGGDTVIIQAHPFRVGFGMTREPSTDGTEVYNMHPHHDSNNDLAYTYAKKHNHIIIAGSDFHHAGSQAGGLILTKTLPADSFELAKILKSRDYLLLVKNQVIIPSNNNL